jgi:hypothetical protein
VKSIAGQVVSDRPIGTVAFVFIHPVSSGVSFFCGGGKLREAFFKYFCTAMRVDQLLCDNLRAVYFCQILEKPTLF